MRYQVVLYGRHIYNFNHNNRTSLLGRFTVSEKFRMKNNVFSGLANPYSFLLLTLLILFTGVGITLLSFGFLLWGMVSLVPAGLIASGFRILSPGEEKDGKKIPRQVGVITVLGQRRYIKVEGLTLVCDQFGFDLIGLTVFEIKKEDFPVPVPNVRCQDGVRVKGEISMSVVADDSDDAADKQNGKTGAQKLWDWHDIGRIEGYKNQVEEIAITGLQDILQAEVPTGEAKRDFKWVESHPSQISLELMKKIQSWRPPGDNNSLDDTWGLGGKILKIQVPLTPINAKVITADEDKAIELLQREAELKDTSTINRQVLERIKFYTKQGLPNVDAKKCRDEVMFERLAKDKKVTISQGGRLVNLRSVGNTDKED